MSADVLDRWYTAIQAGDATALGMVTTDDVVVRWNGPVGLIPWAGVWEGRAKVLTFFRRVSEHLEVLSITTVLRLETQAAVVVVLDGEWRVRVSGETIKARAANIFRFEGERVAAYEVYPDSAAFLAALSRA